MHDAVVIGSGPNGLVAAATLACAGWKVLVLEAQSRPGGAVYSLESTLPGYLHDVGAAFFPFAVASPALSSLRLDEMGLSWKNGIYESSHPALDGSCASISQDLELSMRSFGEDAKTWRNLAEWQKRMGEQLPRTVLAPLPALGPAWRLGIGPLTRLIRPGLSSPAGYARYLFKTEPARRVIPALSLHVDLGPDDRGGAALGLMLALLGAGWGFPVPVGGARAITDALIRRLEREGGEVRLQAHVERIVVREGRGQAVKTSRGEEIPFRRAVLADVGAPALYLKMLPEAEISGWIRGRMKKFRYGWGTFKMDWALSAPVPWTCAEPRQSAVVHTGESIEELTTFTNQVRAGELPTSPYLVIGQQSLFDSTRAPVGGHTLWAYSHVPSTLPEGWPACRERFADRIEERIEGLAPGFRSLIRARAIFSPTDLEAMNENLVGGDLGGGSAQLDQQLFFRPVFPYFRYRTPVEGVYLCSASTHPGAGVHGACGYNAAQQALRDRG